jgi:hypothetical protein
MPLIVSKAHDLVNVDKDRHLDKTNDVDLCQHCRYNKSRKIPMAEDFILDSAEVNEWSKPQPTQNPGEVVSLLSRRVLIELGLTHCLYILRKNGATTGGLPLHVAFLRKSCE